jgi:hypothetical protein
MSSEKNFISYNPELMKMPIVDADNVAYYTLFKSFNLSNFLNSKLPIDFGLIDEIKEEKNSHYQKCQLSFLKLIIEFLVN